MAKNNSVYLLYRIGKSAMQSGLAQKDLWALVPKNSKGMEYTEQTFRRQSQGVLHFENKNLAIQHCQTYGFQFIEMPDISQKKIRPKSYTNTIVGVQD